jgi:hypothetical protein
MRRVMRGVMALLLVVAGEAAAQAYPIRALGHDMDLQALDAFAERRTERFGPLERSERWRLYGRFGLLNFQDQPDPNGSGVQISWRRTGPALGTKIYVGIHRRF